MAVRRLALAALLLVAEVAAAATEPDELMPGVTCAVKAGAYARFIAKPPSGTIFDLPDADHQPTALGGSLQMFDTSPLNYDTSTFSLPAAGWAAVGTPPGSRGFRYRGAGTPADPCSVFIRPQGVKARCRGGGNLHTPFAADVGIVLGIGTANKRYCATFGGTTVKNDSTALSRRRAPAPASCPMQTICTTTTTIMPCTLRSGSCTGISACPGHPSGATCLSDGSGGCMCAEETPPPCAQAGTQFCQFGTCPAGQTCGLVSNVCGPAGCECH